MHKAAALLGVAALTLSGCVVYSDGGVGGGGGGATPFNFSPFVSYADAGCYYDGAYQDNIWYFEADVDDGDGPLDITQVYADVYDGYTGQYIETFELYPTNDPYIWFSDWLEYSTYLDCYYRGYEVDIVAYDAYDAFDVVTVLPATF
ncbi:MAG: hypothetical protein AAFV53_41605 [Myxococcota bacterium]